MPAIAQLSPVRPNAPAIVACLVAAGLLFVAPPLPLAAQSDLDEFMREVVSARDENWRKLQQYILDEREQVELRGPSGALLWGERRDYMWYIREGYFVRSPVRVNGAAVSASERDKYEADYLHRAQERDKRQQEADAANRAAGLPSAPASGLAAADDAPRDLDSFIKQTRQPQFISSAYFLRFRFDGGRYALAGREQLDGREVLRVEYYPQQLFTEERRRERREETGRRRTGPRRPNNDADRALDAELMRLMNTSSVVTLWIDQPTRQILKYDFDGLDWNFFPAQWLLQVDKVSASMSMGQPFKDVWLPRSIDMRVGLALAFGRVELRYDVDYDNYRQADVQMKYGVTGRP